MLCTQYTSVCVEPIKMLQACARQKSSPFLSEFGTVTFLLTLGLTPSLCLLQFLVDLVTVVGVFQPLHVDVPGGVDGVRCGKGGVEQSTCTSAIIFGQRPNIECEDGSFQLTMHVPRTHGQRPKML